MVTLAINKYFNRALMRPLATLIKLKQKAYSYPLIAMILSSCGSNTSSTTDTTITDDSSTAPVTSNSMVVVAEVENLGLTGVNDTITATSSTLITGTSVVDTDPYDEDSIIITATDDILGTPIINGIEKITFTISKSSLK